MTLRSDLISGFPMVNRHPDVAGLLRDHSMIKRLQRALADPFRERGVTKVIGPEARGMMLGVLVAAELGAGLVCARKAGRNHPGADLHFVSKSNWTGTPEEFQMRTFDIEPGDVVAIVDDWVTTGSSLEAIIGTLDSFGATYVGASVIVDKSEGDTKDRLGVTALVEFHALTRGS